MMRSVVTLSLPYFESEVTKQQYLPEFIQIPLEDIEDFIPLFEVRDRLGFVLSAYIGNNYLIIPLTEYPNPEDLLKCGYLILEYGSPKNWEDHTNLYN